MSKLKVGSDFSGVGAFDQALIRLGIDYDTVFSCDMDKYARDTYVLNYGEPKYFPTDVYEREIPKESLDIYMTSPPCQAFSLAGKRKGEEDKRGVLFYNSHEFIEKNRPRYFIFENVKGLLSDDGGKTFQRWIDFLGGKSVNGNPVIFPHEESVPYHIYYKVMNAKNYGVPQNRERIFIVGIRDDQDNDFSFPVEIELKKRLKDVLETFETSSFKSEEEFNAYMKKYFLSSQMIKGFISHSEKHKEKGTGFQWKPKDENDIANCIAARGSALGVTDNSIKVGFINQDTQASQVFDENGLGQTLCAGTHGYSNGYVKIGAIRGHNPDNPKSRQSGLQTEQMLEINEQGLSNCLTTVQKDNVVVEFNLPGKHEQNSRVYNINGVSPTLTTMQRGGQEPKVVIKQLPRGRNKGGEFEISTTITSNSWHENNFLKVKSANLQGYEIAEEGSINFEHPNSEIRRGRGGKGVAQTLTTSCNQGIYSSLKIRKLTPRECFRLMDFPDSFKWNVSNSQAYKQAGNSIVVGVLALIIKKLKL